MQIPIRFIIIDDDLINNMLCQIAINKAATGLEVKTFNVPEAGFDYIYMEYTGNEAAMHTILFLDINMPTWTGWDFLDNFEKLSEKVKNRIKIYILSSSVDSRDRERALANSNVEDYIVKPLNTEIVTDIIINQIESKTPFSESF